MFVSDVDGTPGLVIITSVTLRNLTNFWSGSWRARYTVAVGAAGTGKAVLNGSIRIATHYFESGNTQMHSEKAIGPIDIADASGASIVSAIAKEEDGLHASLEEMYESLSSHALKEMRRFLPVSGSKMNWNVAGHRLAKALVTGGGASAAAST